MRRCKYQNLHVANLKGRPEGESSDTANKPLVSCFDIGQTDIPVIPSAVHTTKSSELVLCYVLHAHLDRQSRPAASCYVIKPMPVPLSRAGVYLWNLPQQYS